MNWDDEKFCQDSFDVYLRKQLQTSGIAWKRVPRGDDPPDFYVTLGQNTFAVEVTRTEIMENAVIGVGQVRMQTYLSSHIRLVKEIEASARESGALSGTYAVLFRSPMSASRFRQAKKDAVKQALDYIQRTHSVDNSPNEAILHQGQPVCWIEKLHSQSNKVREVFQGAAWVESPEVKDEVCQILQHALEDKKAKFEAKGEPVPKILLLLNTYDFASPAMYRDCIHRVKDVDFFHSVFVVWPNGGGFLLHTSDEEWSEYI